ncbi:MAG: hypothetical protein ABSA84_03290 [Gammaproteobacteria bacterium]|jgi:hypothetical protein
MYSEKGKQQDKEKDKKEEISPSSICQARARRVYHQSGCFTLDLKSIPKVEKHSDDESPKFAKKAGQKVKFEDALVDHQTKILDDDSDHCSEFSGQDIDKKDRPYSAVGTRKSTPHSSVNCAGSSSAYSSARKTTELVDDQIVAETILDEPKAEQKVEQHDVTETTKITEGSDDDSEHCSEFSGQDTEFDKKARSNKLLM